MPFGLRPWHIIAIVVVALIIFGPARLPQLGKSMGKFFKDLRDGAKDMSSGFKDGLNDAQATAASVVDAAKSASAQPPSPGPVAQAALAPEGEKASSAGNFCTYCGAANPLDAKFCNTCGHKIKA